MKQNYLRVGWVLLTLFLFLFCSLQTFSQTTVNGTVSEYNGPPIPGVAVVVVGTTTGVSTGADGKYSISVPSGKNALSFSAVGYVKKSVNIDGRTQINVGMASDVSNLNEVVITGYQSQRKSDITGAVSVVNTKDIRSTPTTNVGEAIQGRVPGVVISSDANPGGSVDIRIRGFQTINNNNPLVIVDGVQLIGGLQDVNPVDIESIQILKDASSSSIYGARAAGGVVLITTRKGKSGKIQLNFDSYSGFSEVNKSYLPKLLNTQQYANVVWQNYANTTASGKTVSDALYGTYSAGSTPTIPQYLVAGLVSKYSAGGSITPDQVQPSLYSYTPLNASTYYTIVKANPKGTNWYDAILRKGLVQSYTLGASGGGDNSHFYFSGNYLENHGILKYTYYNRAGIRANSDFTIKNHIRLGENITFTYSNENGNGNNNSTNDGGEGSAISYAYRIQPIVPIYDIAGNFAGTLGKGLGNAQNPLAILNRNFNNTHIATRFLGNAFLDFDIINGLSFKTSMSVDLNNFNNSTFQFPDLENTEGTSNTSLNVENLQNSYYNFTNILTYKKKFGKSNFKAFIGNEAVSNQQREFSAQRTGYPLISSSTAFYLNAGQGVETNGSYQSDYSFSSYLGQINYDYNEKYLIELRFRRDGGSVFNAKYGNFPGASIGWKISKEEFLSNVNWINDLKLRLGYGVVGNANIPSYNFANQFGSSPTNNTYSISGGANSYSPGTSLTNQGNPNTTWETDKSLNGGIDAALFNNSWNLVLDVYKNISSDLLNAPNNPGIEGSATPASVNIGSLQNTGFDLGITYNGKADNGKFKYNIGANISHYKNQITKLDNVNGFIEGGVNPRIANITRTKAGEPIGQFFGYKVLGIFQNETAATAAPDQTALGLPNQAGNFQFADINHDGKIDANDRTYIGDPNPKLTGGLTLDASYNGFDFNAFLTGVFGNKIFNLNKYYTDFQTFPGNYSTRILNSWTPGNPNAILPIINANQVSTEAQVSSYYVENGSYVRLKNLQLGYTFPKSMVSKYGIDRIRIFIQSTNLFTITKYDGLDPDVTINSYSQIGSSTARVDLTRGVDYGRTPHPKQFLIGLSVTL